MNNTKYPSSRPCLEDDEIVTLYWERDEKAIEETDKKYGKYLYTIANNIVRNHQDCEECLNDAYLGTWNRIPPARPTFFQAFLSKITRNVAIDRFRMNTAEKRIPSELTASLDELGDCIAYDGELDTNLVVEDIVRVLNKCLAQETRRKQFVFICRYYYADSIANIATSLGMSEKTVARELAQVRANLRTAFEKEGYFGGTQR